jgi:hypothetical protein
LENESSGARIIVDVIYLVLWMAVIYYYIIYFKPFESMNFEKDKFKFEIKKANDVD